MKKLMAVLLAASMIVLLLASCGGDGESTTTNAITTVTTETTTAQTTTETTTTAEATTEVATEATTAETTTEETTTETTTEEAPVVPEVKKELILHLDFEAANIEGNVIKNAVGEGLDATITGSPVYETGVKGKAIRFGKGTSFDFLTIANDERLNFDTTDEFTIEFSYKLDKKAEGWDNLFSKGSSGNGWYGVWLGKDDSSSGGVCWGGDTGNFRIGLASEKEKWHKITIIQRGGMIHMFLDDTYVNSTMAKSYTSETNFYLGGRNSNGTDGDASAQFHGWIDEFKIYNYDIGLQTKGIASASMGEYTYTAEGGDSITLPYRIYYPAGYEDSGKQYAVMVYLHGHGECGSDNVRHIKYGDEYNSFLSELADSGDCIVLAPQTECDRATNVSEWFASGTGRYFEHAWAGSFGMKAREGALEEITYTLGLQAVTAMVEDLIAEDYVDANRIYISGVSMGGCGTWEIIARRPDLFAAAIPMCGSAIVSTADRLLDIAIWAFHGLSDNTVQPAGSQLICDAIKAAGGTKVTLTTVKDMGHDIAGYAYSAKTESGQTLAEWVLSQSKAK